MSTEDAINEYVDLAEYIFGERKWYFQDGMFKATRLKTAIQRIVQKYGEPHDPEEDILDTRTQAEGACKA
jgi:hypothetical protein